MCKKHGTVLQLQYTHIKRSFSNNVLNLWYSEQIFYIGKLEDQTSKKTLPTTICQHYTDHSLATAQVYILCFQSICNIALIS